MRALSPLCRRVDDVAQRADHSRRIWRAPGIAPEGHARRTLAYSRCDILHELPTILGEGAAGENDGYTAGLHGLGDRVRRHRHGGLDRMTAELGAGPAGGDD